MKTALTAMPASRPTMKEVGESIVFVTDIYERLGKGGAHRQGAVRCAGEAVRRHDGYGDEARPVAGACRGGAEEADRAPRPGLCRQPHRSRSPRSCAPGPTRRPVDPRQHRLHQPAHRRRRRRRRASTRRCCARKPRSRKQLYGGAISQLEDAIKRLTYGDLANAHRGRHIWPACGRPSMPRWRRPEAGDVDAVWEGCRARAAPWPRRGSSTAASGPRVRGRCASEILAIFSELQVQMAGEVLSQGRRDQRQRRSNRGQVCNTMQELQATIGDANQPDRDEHVRDAGRDQRSSFAAA